MTAVLSQPKQKNDTILRMLNCMRVPRDGVLFVHSAFKQLGQDGYGVNAVLESFMQYMQPGTLLMPTMSWRYVKPDKPFFDELNTPSNTGILTELFRTQYATYRSVHPTHSVAGLGHYAQEMLATHQFGETPCGQNSPYAKLVEHDAFIVMLGVGMDCCTLIHHVEEIIAPEIYVRSQNEMELYQCRKKNADVIEVKLRRHLFLPRNYWQFQDTLAAQNELAVFRCDNAICIGFSAKKLFDVVVNALKKCKHAIIAQPGQRYRMM